LPIGSPRIPTVWAWREAVSELGHKDRGRFLGGIGRAHIDLLNLAREAGEHAHLVPWGEIEHGHARKRPGARKPNSRRSCR
jgi:hypothetical protein